MEWSAIVHILVIQHGLDFRNPSFDSEQYDSLLPLILSLLVLSIDVYIYDENFRVILAMTKFELVLSTTGSQSTHVKSPFLYG